MNEQIKKLILHKNVRYSNLRISDIFVHGGVGWFLDSFWLIEPLWIAWGRF